MPKIYSRNCDYCGKHYVGCGDRYCSSSCSAKAYTHTRKPIEERLWSKIKRGNPDECWEWSGTKSLGYGQIKINGKMIHSHRLVWELTYGKIPDGLFCLHRCDNRGCNNPKHLFLGTAKDNVDDMEIKGRAVHPKGSKAGTSKLTESQVIEIRGLRQNGVPIKVIAKVYAVHFSQISSICTRRTWKHI